MNLADLRPCRSSDAAGGRPKPSGRERAAIAVEHTWDLSHIYPDWPAWEADLERLVALMERYAALKGTLAGGAEALLAASLLSDELGQLAYRVYRYPALMLEEDTRANAIQERVGRVEIAFARFAQATAWFKPELLAIPVATVRDWVAATPALTPYRFGLEEVYRLQAHTLDEAGERLLALSRQLAGTPAQTYSMMADADVVFPTVSLSSGVEVVASHANYINGLRTLRSQSDRELLFRAHFGVFDRSPNTYAAVYDGVLQRDWFLAQARGYATTLDADLDPNAIAPVVVERLVATARAGATPLQRYNHMRRSALRLERYRYFDAYLPLLEVDWPFYYDQVRARLVESVALFGADYQATVDRAFSERWIDVYESEGKRSGAFSAGVYGVHPYMLLNYADTLNDAFTVAHEMGHTLHTVLSHRRQPFATASYTIFVAEVASMTNENLFLDRLLATESDPARRVALLEYAIDDIASGFYRQAMFADFELAAHRRVEAGQPVTAEVLQALYLDTLHAFFGDSLDDQEWYRNGWARIPHFFHSPYYVYQYATAKAAASLLHRRMTEGPASERAATVASYLELLSSGGDDHPVIQLQRAGVDFTTPEPIDALVATMGELVDRLEVALRDVVVAV